MLDTRREERKDRCALLADRMGTGDQKEQLKIMPTNSDHWVCGVAISQRQEEDTGMEKDYEFSLEQLPSTRFNWTHVLGVQHRNAAKDTAFRVISTK